MTRRSCHRLGCGAAVGAGNGARCGSPSHSGCGRRMGSAWCAVGVGLGVRQHGVATIASMCGLGGVLSTVCVPLSHDGMSTSRPPPVEKRSCTSTVCYPTACSNILDQTVRGKPHRIKCIQFKRRRGRAGRAETAGWDRQEASCMSHGRKPRSVAVRHSCGASEHMRQQRLCGL
jgi:hypothetical protein